MENETIKEKQRHGCLTVWLAAALLMNSTWALWILLGTWIEGIDVPFLSWVDTVFVLANLVWAIALFQWKKWGFFGFCISASCGIVINLFRSAEIMPILWGFISMVLLYGVLQIGSENKGWPQLE